MDPTLGVDQSKGAYWRRRHEYFHGNKKFESNRTYGSLMKVGPVYTMMWMCFVDVCLGLRIWTTVVAQLMITSFSANILFVSYDHLSLFSCLCWFRLCKSQMHVHSSRLKIRSTGSLPTCICWKILKDKPKTPSGRIRGRKLEVQIKQVIRNKR